MMKCILTEDILSILAMTACMLAHLLLTFVPSIYFNKILSVDWESIRKAPLYLKKINKQIQQSISISSKYHELFHDCFSPNSLLFNSTAFSNDKFGNMFHTKPPKVTERYETINEWFY